MEAARELAQLLERLGELGARGGEDLGRLVDVGGQPRLGEAERERERREALLGSVVQVALEAPAGGVGRGDDPRARGPDLLFLALALGDVGAGEQHARRPPLVEDRRRRPGDDALAGRPGSASGSRARPAAPRSRPRRSPSARRTRRRRRRGRGTTSRRALRPARRRPRRMPGSRRAGRSRASWSVTTTKLGIVLATTLAKSHCRCSSTSRRFRSVMSMPPGDDPHDVPVLVEERRGLPRDDALLAAGVREGVLVLRRREPRRRLPGSARPSRLARPGR